MPRVDSGSEWLASIDRLGWNAGMSATCFGVRVGVRVNDAAWIPKLQEHLPPGWQPSESPIVDYLYSMRLGGSVPGTRIRRFHLAFAGPSQIAKTLDSSIALEVFEGAVRFDVAVAAEPWVFVHAGVVGVNGRAIVIPATSMCGKTRLVEALVRAGATYYSDEYAVIGKDGLVRPFARKLSIRDDAGGARRVSAADLGGQSGVEPLPIGVVLSTRYEVGREWRPRPGSPGECVMAMLTHTVRARLSPAAVLETLARASHRATLLDGPRGEGAAVADELLHLAATTQ